VSDGPSSHVTIISTAADLSSKICLDIENSRPALFILVLVWFWPHGHRIDTDAAGQGVLAGIIELSAVGEPVQPGVETARAERVAGRAKGCDAADADPVGIVWARFFMQAAMRGEADQVACSQPQHLHFGGAGEHGDGVAGRETYRNWLDFLREYRLARGKQVPEAGGLGLRQEGFALRWGGDAIDRADDEILHRRVDDDAASVGVAIEGRGAGRRQAGQHGQGKRENG